MLVQPLLLAKGRTVLYINTVAKVHIAELKSSFPSGYTSF